MNVTKFICVIKLCFSLICLLFFLNCVSEGNKNLYERYDKKVWNGMLHYHNNEYEKSLESFHDALSLINNDNPSVYFYAAAASLQLDDTINAKKLIIESIIKTNTSKEYFLNFKEFDQFREKKLFSEISDNYDTYIDSFFQTIKNPEVYKMVDSLIQKDQFARNSEISLEDRSLIDSLNVISLIEITKKYGWHERGG